MKALLSNLGFVMQFSGIIIIIPIIMSFAFQETNAIIGLLITAIAFFALGFLLNALCERKELGIKSSSGLLVMVFVVLSLIGAIPYIYLDITSASSMMQRIVDGIFESASGFTTTGYSVITDISILPKSLIIYRALTQFIGGIGIVLVLLAFFFPEEKLRKFSVSMGFPENHRIKKTFFMILLIYFLYAIAIVGISFLMGYKDILNLVSYALSTISTGGFAPVNDIGPLMTSNIVWVFIIGMVLGASNFIILAGLLKFRIIEFIKSEVSVFLLMIMCVVSFVVVYFKLAFMDSTFHVVSAMTNTGFGYLNISEFNPHLKFLLTFFMFIGGTSLSTAGGIKIFRLLLLFKSLRKSVADTITGADNKVTLFGRTYSSESLIQCLIVIFLMLFVVLLCSFLLISHGYNSADSFFEVTSALSNTGLSAGILTAASSVNMKIMFIVIMLLGRVEVIAFLIMISWIREPKREDSNISINIKNEYEGRFV